MTTAQRKAEAHVGGFASASRSTRWATAGRGLTLTEVNNDLLLLVDALRYVVEVASARVITKLRKPKERDA